MIPPRRGYVVHGLVLHLMVRHRRLYLRLQSIQPLCQLLDISMFISQQPGQPWEKYGPQRENQTLIHLPFARTALHGDATELTSHTEAATVGAGFDTGFRSGIAANLFGTMSS
jgi:hypothetical protein